MRQQDRAAGRTDGQAGDRVFNTLASQIRIFVQRSDRVFDQLPTSFAADNKRGFDLSKLDHIRCLNHAGKNPQASVGNIVDHAIGRQARLVVHRTSRRRLQKVSTNGTVNQASDLRRIDLCSLDSQLAAFDA